MNRLLAAGMRISWSVLLANKIGPVALARLALLLHPL